MSALGGIASSIIGARAADKAADAKRDSLNQAIRGIEAGAEQTEGRLKPIADIATPTAEMLQGLIMGTEDIQNSPGYQFRLGEGLDAIESSAAARGGLNSGGTLKALQRYGQDYATQDYDNQLTRLGNLFNVAQPAFSTYADLPLSLAQQRSPLYQEIGNTTAANRLAKGQAWQSGIQAVNDSFSQAAGMFTGGFGGGMGGGV